MPGIKGLRKYQLGLESTKGTAVPATTIWRGEAGGIEDQRETVFPREDIGILGGTTRAYTPKLLAGLAMPATPATFEQLPYVLAAGVQDVVTGAADGAGSGKIYTYNLPETTANTTKAYTIEAGDNQEVEEMEYSQVSEYTLEGAGGEALMKSPVWFGRQVTVSAFTAALSLPNIEEILVSKAKLYIDAVGGSYGGTQKSNTLLGISFKHTTGWIPVFAADGQLYFSLAKYTDTEEEILLDITFEHDGSATAEKVNWRNRTPRLIQVKFEGSALATPGTTYTYKTLILNLAGMWDKFSELGEQDGNDIVTGTFRVKYNSTKADKGQIIVVNELASLP